LPRRGCCRPPGRSRYARSRRCPRGDALTELEHVWRDHWGRLTALLVAQFRRLDLAEDGLADAFESAARTWPRDGVPANPPAWLLTAARRRILDRLRAEAVAARALPRLAVESDLQEEAQRVMVDAGEPVRDERLRLVMLCAHPALSRENAAALTLRLVLGVTTDDIARLFLVPTPTMAARLTRARKSLAGERFEVPVGPELRDRLQRAADVAYLTFTAGYTPPTGPELVRTDLAAEAIRLARVLVELLPGNPELDGLLGLMLLQHSRRDARMRAGRLVLLPDQDRALWHADEVTEALDLLSPHVTTAPGTPYLLQALIASEHAIARRPEDTDWSRIVERYDELVAVADSPVVRLNRAVALAEADGPLAGLRALDGLELPGHRLPGVRGELLARVGRADEARDQLTLAVELCDNEPERAHLADRLAELGAH
jgi:predicted RNA polymerase sigma factor